MWGRFVLLVIISGSVCNIQAQRPVGKGLSLPQAKTFFTSIAGLSFSQKTEYSLSFSSFSYFNWTHDNSSGNIVFLQNLKYSWQSESQKGIKFSNNLVHNLGIQIFPDSLTKVNTDDNTLNTRIDVKLGLGIGATLSSIISTRLLNGYDYSINDSGTQVRRLNSACLTPLIWTFSGGFSYKAKKTGTIVLGGYGFKFTWVRDKVIFKEQDISSFYGVDQSKNFLLEWGVNLQFTADRDLLKWMHWYCDFLLFKKHNSPWDMNLKNQFGFKISRYLKLMVQTRIFYEEQVSKKVQFENLVSFGFTISL